MVHQAARFCQQFAAASLRFAVKSARRLSAVACHGRHDPRGTRLRHPLGTKNFRSGNGTIFEPDNRVESPNGLRPVCGAYGDFPMRIFIIFAVTAILVAIGYVAGHAYFSRSQEVASTAAASNTLSPHEIHLNYKAMKTLPVHDVKDAF
jgi:hypothetical protein